jgi:alginate O-acetyltransferase complex protein AlgJ
LLRRASGSALSPDPRPAIQQFNQKLAARGITLILMPTPGKPAIHPERLAEASGESREPLQNLHAARLSTAATCWRTGL